ncbi:MAG: AI-2E family transporter YdiK [Gallionellaceae bacterium]|jgi:predicted PurR-regulated permease PerM|nr:AI-2E family transporter YdiK [Gallionellaceae bacterium]
MEKHPPPYDLARILLVILFLGLIVGGSLWVLRPFLPALIWAVMIVVSTWPMLLGLQARLRGRRVLASLIMVTLMLLLVIVPLAATVITLADSSEKIAGHTMQLIDGSLPPPPEWVHRIPLIGEPAAEEWQELADNGADGLRARLAPYAGTTTHWMLAQIGNMGALMVHFLLTLGIAAVLYIYGEKAADNTLRFARRLAPTRGETAARLAGQAIRAVALGVVVTAAVQSVLSLIALSISGVPGAGLLTALIFMLCVAQIGPLPVLAPAVIWLFWEGDTGWAIALLVMAVIISTFDSVLRPVLIRRGADLPLLLIFAGVIGGLLAFGFVGLFVGPVLLAVAYTLLAAWVTEPDQVAQPKQMEPPEQMEQPPEAE